MDPAEIEDRLAIAQSRDDSIKKLRSILECRVLEGYCLNDGLVYKSNRGGGSLLYVPAEMEDNVIRAAHETVGHQAVDKTVEYLRRHYWMPGMKSKTEKHIRNCIQCIMYSCPVKAGERGLYMIPKKPVALDTIHIDNIGPLPATKSKRKHILVVVDGFTKFVRLYPVLATSTKEMLCALKHYFRNYSRPRRIVSDRGTCFTSAEFSSFMIENNIEHIRVATASPQANGQVERTNRTLKAMLGKLSDPVDQADWTKIIEHAEFAINNSVNKTTRTTPAELFFGTIQRGPTIDRLGEYLEDKVVISKSRQELRDLAA